MGPVVAITSKFVTEMLLSRLKALAGQRLSGATEMEKNPPLSATIAPYFFNARRTAFSCFVHASGIANEDRSRPRGNVR